MSNEPKYRKVVHKLDVASDIAPLVGADKAAAVQKLYEDTVGEIHRTGTHGRDLRVEEANLAGDVLVNSTAAFYASCGLEKALSSPEAKNDPQLTGTILRDVAVLFPATSISELNGQRDTSRFRL